jgi:hypothetical protein
MNTSVRLIVAGDSKWPQTALLNWSGIRQLTLEVQILRERSAVLRNKYIAFLVLFHFSM